MHNEPVSFRASDWDNPQAKGALYRSHFLPISPLREAAAYLKTGASYNDINAAERLGALSHRGARAARLMWRWSAPRLADRWHDVAYERLGADGLNRRIARVNALFARLA